MGRLWSGVHQLGRRWKTVRWPAVFAISVMACTPVASPYAYWLLQADPQPRGDVRKVAEWIVAEAAQVRQWQPVA